VILPRENEPDLEELPPETRRALEFVLVDSVDEVFDAAFDGNRAGGRRRTPTPVRQAARPR
jgi:ATP-dependent Lon protease